LISDQVASEIAGLEGFFKEIDDNQKALDKLKETTQGRNRKKDGFESAMESEKGEVMTTPFYLKGRDHHVVKKTRQAAERNGRKRKTRNAETHEETRKRAARKKRKKRGQGRREDKEGDEPGIEVFLRACQFVNPRRDVSWAGRCFRLRAQSRFKPASCDVPLFVDQRTTCVCGLSTDVRA